MVDEDGVPHEATQDDLEHYYAAAMIQSGDSLYIIHWYGLANGSEADQLELFREILSTFVPFRLGSAAWPLAVYNAGDKPWILAIEGDLYATLPGPARPGTDGGVDVLVVHEAGGRAGSNAARRFGTF